VATRGNHLKDHSQVVRGLEKMTRARGGKGKADRYLIQRRKEECGWESIKPVPGEGKKLEEPKNTFFQ